MAERLRMDSPLSRRIVVAFLDFLQTVELAKDVDPEGVHVARECLEQAFKLNQSSKDDQIPHGLLADLFGKYCSLEKQGQSPPTCNSEPDTVISSQDAAKESKQKDLQAEAQSSGASASRDELFGQFYAALDKINYFTSTPDGEEDHAQLAKATKFFEEAIIDLEKSGAEKISIKRLASSFKTQGNHAVQSKWYSKAIDLYTCAIALEEKNAVFYCNRAAAYTQLKKYQEAIADCDKSIALDPSYSKAHSRLGLARYEQGQYFLAMSAFEKALELDPNNAANNSNYQMARRRWEEASEPSPSPWPSVQRGRTIPIPWPQFPSGGVNADEPESGVHYVVGGAYNLSA